MKFIDKIRILEQDPKFQEARRKLKAMWYVASKNPKLQLILSECKVIKADPTQRGYGDKIEGWKIILDDMETQYPPAETLVLLPLSEHNIQEV